MAGSPDTVRLNGPLPLALDPRTNISPIYQPIKGAAFSGAESPTTARPLEMDDDDFQEPTVLSGTASPSRPDQGDNTAKPTTTTATTTTTTTTTASKPESPTAGSGGDAEAPPKPPRPMTETQKNTITLKEAFPTVDDAVIRAVLSASGGQVEPAFNALLGMYIRDCMIMLL